MTSVHVLGAGTPTPTAHRFGSSFVIQTGNDQIMLDCGPATTYKLVKAGLWPTDINHLFFTHHHFDHDIDYPCFLLCRWDQSIGKENTLNVFGPKLTEKLTEEIYGNNGAFSHDWKARINHPLSQKVYENRGGTLPRTPPKANARDITPGTVKVSKKWEVVSDVAEHVQPYLDSLAYRLETSKNKSIVFTGDTQPCKSVVDLSKNADYLVCMCWDDQEAMNENGEFYGQCGTEGAAQMAQDAGVKNLVLVHMGPNISQEKNKIVAEDKIRKIYNGNIIFSDEIKSIDLWSK